MITITPQKVREAQQAYLKMPPKSREEFLHLVHLTAQSGNAPDLSHYFTPEALKAIEAQESPAE